MIVAVLLPLPAMAEHTHSSIEEQVTQLLTTAANLQAQINAMQAQATLACAVFSSAKAVHVNQPFILAWGSVGAMSPGDDQTMSVYVPNGSQKVIMDRLGTWKYSFDFYDAAGHKTTCSTVILVY